jgi:hypothetical protein
MILGLRFVNRDAAAGFSSLCAGKMKYLGEYIHCTPSTVGGFIFSTCYG